ncbi:MAG: serine hydrolase domain-containing protein [Acidobacteriota bacterium]
MSTGGASPRGGSADLEAFLDQQIEAGYFPGAVAVVGDAEGVLARAARGHAVLEPERRAVQADTLFDLGSLTQPLVTAPLALLLHVVEGFDLELQVRKFLPELDRLDKRELTVRDLLLHRAGLPAWAPLYAHGLERSRFLRALGDQPLVYAPRSRVLPSDIGYFLLGEVVARVGSAPLDLLARELLFEPLGATGLGFGPYLGERRLCTAATERGDAGERERAGKTAPGYNGWRQEMIWGEVHDHNCWVLGGVSGHAGLFGSAPELCRYGLEFLGRGRGLFPERLLALLRMEETAGCASGRTLCWRLARSAGNGLPPTAIGHDATTGASVWIDPALGRLTILLGNCLHPHRRACDMDALRRDYHRLACALS